MINHHGQFGHAVGLSDPSVSVMGASLTSIASINATTERMDRLFDYLIRRDQG